MTVRNIAWSIGVSMDGAGMNRAPEWGVEPTGANSQPFLKHLDPCIGTPLNERGNLS